MRGAALEALNFVTFLLSGDFRLYFNCIAGLPFFSPKHLPKGVAFGPTWALGGPEVAPRLGLIGGTLLQHRRFDQASAFAKVIARTLSSYSFFFDFAPLSNVRVVDLICCMLWCVSLRITFFAPTRFCGFPFVCWLLCLDFNLFPSRLYGGVVVVGLTRALGHEIAPPLGLVGGIPVQHPGSHQGSACAKIMPQASSYCFFFSNLGTPSLCRFGRF